MDDYEDYRDSISEEFGDKSLEDDESGESTSSEDRAELEAALYSQLHFDHDEEADLTGGDHSEVVLQEAVIRASDQHELNWRERLLGSLHRPNGSVTPITPAEGNQTSATEAVNSSKRQTRTTEKLQGKEAESKKETDIVKKVKKTREKKKSKSDGNNLSTLLFRDEPKEALEKKKNKLNKASTPKTKAGSRVIIVSHDSDDNDSNTEPDKLKKVFLDDLIVLDSISGSESDVATGSAKNPISLDSTVSDISLIESASDSVTSSDSDDSDDDSVTELQPATHTADIQTNLTGVRRSTPTTHNVSVGNLELDDYMDLTVEDIHDSLGECNWNLRRSDIFNTSSISKSRYFNELNVKCHNCKERGHLSKICPKPRKVPVCFLCGEDGHVARACSLKICFNCLCVGHQRERCSYPRRSLYAWCKRCGMQGHKEDLCTDEWRQYHMTTKDGPLNEVDQKKNPQVFCYNCARKGHWGHECEEDGMDRYKFAQWPFVAVYQLSVDESPEYSQGYNTKRSSQQKPSKTMSKRQEKMRWKAEKIRIREENIRKNEEKHKKEQKLKKKEKMKDLRLQSKRRKAERWAEGASQTQHQEVSQSAFVRNSLQQQPERDASRRQTKKRKTQNERFEAEYQQMTKQVAQNAERRKDRKRKYATRDALQSRHAERDFPRGGGASHQKGKGKMRWNNDKQHHESLDFISVNKRARFDDYREQPNTNSRKQKQGKRKKTFVSERGFHAYH